MQAKGSYFFLRTLFCSTFNVGNGLAVVVVVVVVVGAAVVLATNPLPELSESVPAPAPSVTPTRIHLARALGSSLTKPRSKSSLLSEQTLHSRTQLAHAYLKVKKRPVRIKIPTSPITMPAKILAKRNSSLFRVFFLSLLLPSVSMSRSGIESKSANGVAAAVVVVAAVVVDVVGPVGGWIKGGTGVGSQAGPTLLGLDPNGLT